MTPTGSTAVMAQRVEPRDSLDDFPTPPWATRAACEFLRSRGKPLRILTAREPCANRGHMVSPLREYFRAVDASDIHDYGAGFPVRDYLADPAPDRVDWTFANPPFRLAEEFIERALITSKRGIAMLVRLAFLEGKGRYARLYDRTPPAFILPFTERVVIHKGKLSPKGSTASAYCWLIWFTSTPVQPTRLHWIPPCRKKLERSSDYPEPLPETSPQFTDCRS